MPYWIYRFEVYKNDFEFLISDHELSDFQVAPKLFDRENDVFL